MLTFARGEQYWENESRHLLTAKSWQSACRETRKTSAFVCQVAMTKPFRKSNGKASANCPRMISPLKFKPATKEYLAQSSVLANRLTGPVGIGHRNNGKATQYNGVAEPAGLFCHVPPPMVFGAMPMC
uniref:Uncharacterized protein n=1 Tax=Trichuris muris TaxID=70415 RepID=A0A5S6QSF3_TRIMR